MTTYQPDDRDALIHRALANPSRLHILDVLRTRRQPLDASDLASEVRLHANTVRSHVRLLEQAGLVRQRPDARGSRGRPHIVFELVPGLARADAYQLLAGILATSLASGDDEPARLAEEAGRAWGHELMRRSDPPEPRPERDSIEQVVDLLEDCGFDPAREQSGDGEHTIVMSSCPFGELADEYVDVVCPVHLGLMRGALDELGARFTAGTLEPHTSTGGCVARLAEAPSS